MGSITNKAHIGSIQIVRVSIIEIVPSLIEFKAIHKNLLTLMLHGQWEMKKIILGPGETISSEISTKTDHESFSFRLT